MSLYYLILWNQVDILQKHFKQDHVHMRLWTKFYGNSSRFFILLDFRIRTKVKFYAFYYNMNIKTQLLQSWYTMNRIYGNTLESVMTLW